MDEDTTSSDDFKLSRVDDHAGRIGHCIVAWTNCQSVWLVIFSQLSRMNLEQCKAVFAAVTSDVTQRSLVVGLAKATLQPDSSALTAIKTASAAMAALINERNAVVHSDWTLPDAAGRIRSSSYGKLFADGYDQDDVDDRLNRLHEKIGTCTDKVVFAALETIREYPSQQAHTPSPSAS